jgi:DNA polymerase-3 subunit alpha
MAWLKVKYPLEFYASILLTSSATNETKFQEYVSEMKYRGISLLPPDVNKSSNRFSICENALLFPLTAISGINDILASNIVHEREINGEFKTFFDFVIRMYAYKISETQIKHLIDAGALDHLYASRETMRYTVLSALQYATLITDENGGQLSLGVYELMVPPMIVMKDDPLENLNKEYDAIGIMLSDNPLTYKKELLKEKGVINIKDALEINKESIIIAGIVKTKKIIHTKKGEPMAFVKIFDDLGEIEITIFPKTFENASRILEKNNIVLVKGHNEVSKGETNFIAEEVELLENNEENGGY